MQDLRKKKSTKFLYPSNEQFVLEIKIPLQQHQMYSILTDTFHTAHAISVCGEEKTLQKDIEMEHRNEGSSILCSCARKLCIAKMSILTVIYGVRTMPSKIPADFCVYRTGRADCKPYMEIQRTYNNQNHSEKKTSWRIHSN